MTVRVWGLAAGRPRLSPVDIALQLDFAPRAMVEEAVMETGMLDYAGIHLRIVALVESSRSAAARSVNALMTATYWEIGRNFVDFE